MGQKKIVENFGTIELKLVFENHCEISIPQKKQYFGTLYQPYGQFKWKFWLPVDCSTIIFGY